MPGPLPPLAGRDLVVAKRAVLCCAVCACACCACSARAIVRPAVHERECSDEEKKWVGAWCELGECAPAWQAWCCVPPAGEAGVNPPGAPP